MKSLLFCFILLCGALCLTAQSAEWQWAVQAGGTSWDGGGDIAVDTQGNQYVTGDFRGTANFGTFSLTSGGACDIFAAKLGASGNWLWTVRAGGTGFDYGYSIAVDGAGNSYLTGIFTGSAAFGPHTITSNGDYDIFVAKLDSNGNWLWACGAGGSGAETRSSIAIDGQGNQYVTGFFRGTASFGAHSLTSNGGSDIYIAKLNAVGTWLWARRAGGSGDDSGLNIAIDNQGNQYVSGYFSVSAAFGPNTLTSGGAYDVFVVKMDTTGNWLWVRRAGGYSTDTGYGVALDGAGNNYVTGCFIGDADFGPQTLNSSGNYDVFVAKLDSDGNWLWACRAGGPLNDWGYSIALDTSGNVLLTGSFGGMGYSGLGSAAFGAYTLTSSGWNDVFVAKLDTSVNWLWAVQAGGSYRDWVTGIALDSAGNAFITGGYADAGEQKTMQPGPLRGSASFGPFTLTCNDYTPNIYVAKLGYPPRPQAPQNLRISRWGDDIRLQWDPVTQDTGGNPFYPFAYKIYTCAYLPNGEFLPLAQVGWAECEYTVFGGALWADRLFFRITAMGEE